MKKEDVREREGVSGRAPEGNAGCGQVRTNRGK